MSKLSVRSAIAVSAIRFDLEDEVQTYFDDKADEFDAATFEADCDRYYERMYTLGFYNWQVGCGDVAKSTYRQFDHCLLTWSQAVDCMHDVMHTFCNAIDEMGGDIIFVNDYEEDRIEVGFVPNGYDYSFTAYIWVGEPEVREEYHIDALADEFWLSPEEIQREYEREARLQKLCDEREALMWIVTSVRQRYDNAWENMRYYALAKESFYFPFSVLQRKREYWTNEFYEAKGDLEGVKKRLSKVNKELKSLS